MDVRDYLKPLLVLIAMLVASSGLIGCETLDDEDEVVENGDLIEEDI